MYRQRPEFHSAGHHTYMDLLLSGDVLREEIDDFVGSWHDAKEGTAVANLSLHDYLGMTWNEYRLWVEHPESLRFIAIAHKADQPVASVLRDLDKTGVAARTSEQSEAHKLLQWLIDKGRVEEVPRW
jgi:hypothetical protein